MVFQQIHIIINPAAGQNEPILNTLNQVFQEYDINWQVSITQGPGDACRLAKEAVAAGVDLVAGYGGDGTLMEVANGLRGSNIPLGILPGGTGNGIARELRIPFNLEQAAELLCQSPTVSQIDVGQIEGQYFLLHAYAGLHPSQQASRDLKDNMGMLAYLLPMLRVIKEPQISHYTLIIDGQIIQTEGIFCAVVNALGLGISFSLTEPVNPKDGLLNLFLIKKDTSTPLSQTLNQEEKDKLFQHWQCREVSIHSQPAQQVWMDGEVTAQDTIYGRCRPTSLASHCPTSAKYK